MMLKEVIFIVKLSLSPTWCWPLPRDVTRFKIFCVKLYHYLSIILLLGLAAPLTYGVINRIDDPPILVQIIVLSCATCHTICNFIFYKINSSKIQDVIFEMIHFSDSMKPHEEIVIQQYVDKYMVFHGAALFTYYCSTFLTIIGPFMTERAFPTLAEYPFDVSYQPLKAIIFIQQSMSGILVAGQLCTNILIALLLWFVSAKFELLAEELEKVTNLCQSFKCIKKHQELLKYAEKVTIVARPFAFITICCGTLSLIATLLLLITNQPAAVIFQFLGMTSMCVTEVFMYTWPAENLIHMCNNVGQTAFYMLKNNHFIEIWKCLQIIIMRSQKPVRITIPCLMPALSLNYFTTYLSTILSYFTTLRIIMDDSIN